MYNEEDAIVRKDGQWYFYDAGWINLVGPYDSEESCKKGMHKYMESL